MSRQRADYWQDRGAADAIVRLMTTGMIRPGVTYADVCRRIGIADRAAMDAIARLKAQTRPSRRRYNAPHAAPSGTKWCGYAGHFVAFEDFGRNRSSTTGYQSWCSACNVQARREQRQRRQERAA